MITVIPPFCVSSKSYEIPEGFHYVNLASGPFIHVANRMTMAHPAEGKKNTSP